MTDISDQILEMLRSIKHEVLETQIKIAELELHLKKQDREAMEILAASRRLLISLEALDDGEEDIGPIQN